MTREVNRPKPAYEKPTIEVLGSVTVLTLGDKWHSLSDLSQGISGAISDGGPGS